MFLLVSKILTPLLQPLGFSLLCFLLGLLLWKFCQRLLARMGAGLMFTGLMILYLSSLQPVATSLMRSLESGYLPVPVNELPVSSVIVILGGGILNPHPPRIEIELNDHGDRLLFAAKLYKAGKAPTIVVSSGNVFVQPGMLSNGEYSSQLLIEWGVNPKDIVVEGKSRTTYENAKNTASLLDSSEQKILLVTSAFHMRRALALFEAQGFDVTAASTDIQSTNQAEPAILHWLPDAYFLMLTSRVIKEYIGYVVYAWRGWL